MHQKGCFWDLMYRQHLAGKKSGRREQELQYKSYGGSFEEFVRILLTRMTYDARVRTGDQETDEVADQTKKDLPVNKSEREISELVGGGQQMSAQVGKEHEAHVQSKNDPTT